MQTLTFFNDSYNLRVIVNEGQVWFPLSTSLAYIGYSSYQYILKTYYKGNDQIAIEFYDNFVNGTLRKTRHIKNDVLINILDNMKQDKKVTELKKWITKIVMPEIADIMLSINKEQESTKPVLTLVPAIVTRAEGLDGNLLIADEFAFENVEPVTKTIDLSNGIFSYNNKSVRTVLIDGEPWFVAKDVCECLSLSNSRSVLTKLDSDEKGVHSMNTPGGMQKLNVVNESGLHTLALRSDKPEAKPFRKWVTRDVLPTIRKTGSYSTNDIVSQTPVLAEYMAMNENQRGIAYFTVKEEVKQLQVSHEVMTEENIALMAQNEKLKPKAEFFDTVIDIDKWFKIGEVAKMIGNKDLGQNNLFRFLRERKILMMDNSPMQKHVNSGYFRIKQTKTPENKDGESYVHSQTMVSQRGIDYILKQVAKYFPISA